uniref:Uncharacterized protein n=1 Tax=Anguilla anguilla TaxID=7936 RepID=A0A0E9TI64_ANGAN
MKAPPMTQLNTSPILFLSESLHLLPAVSLYCSLGIAPLCFTEGRWLKNLLKI